MSVATLKQSTDNRPAEMPLQPGERVIAAQGLGKCYRRGAERLHALSDVSFEISAGEYVSIIGSSGAGKSTLLHLIGCMDTPTEGSLRIDGLETSRLNDRGLTRLRREKIGFVFQHFGLVPTLTVLENVLLPTLFARRNARARGEQLLERVGLADRRDHRPGELSGGEMQRAAIARALINDPRLLLADEPTGNLDTKTGDRILTLFRELSATGLTIVVVTHNPELASEANRQLTLQDGVLQSDTRARRASPSPRENSL